MPEAVYCSVLVNSYHGTSVYQVSLLEDQPQVILGTNTIYEFLLPEAVCCLISVSKNSFHCKVVGKRLSGFLVHRFFVFGERKSWSSMTTTLLDVPLRSDETTLSDVPLRNARSVQAASSTPTGGPSTCMLRPRDYVILLRAYTWKTPGRRATTITKKKMMNKTAYHNPIHL